MCHLASRRFVAPSDSGAFAEGFTLAWYRTQSWDRAGEAKGYQKGATVCAAV